MPRATILSITKVCEAEDDVDLSPFIDMASQIVAEVCESSGYAESRLAIIETQLAAHFYKMSLALTKSSETAGPVSESFSFRGGLFLQNTPHGQTAMLMDTAGNLATLSQLMTDGGLGFVPEITVHYVGHQRCRPRPLW